MWVRLNVSWDLKFKGLDSVCVCVCVCVYVCVCDVSE